MLKRIILFALVVTTVPALIMSFPVLATDEDLRINLTGNGISATTYFKIWGSSLSNYQAPFGEAIHHLRDEDVMFFATYQNQSPDKECEVLGRNDKVIPLKHEGEVIEEVSVSLTLEGGTLVCVVDLLNTPPPPVGDKTLLFYVYTDVAAALTVTDYKEEQNLATETYSAGMGRGTEFIHTLHADTTHATIDYGTHACRFNNGTGSTDITAPAMGEATIIYVDITQEGDCHLSLTEPPPRAIQISSCQELAGITDMSETYELSQDINCSGVKFEPIHVGGPFTGKLYGNNKTITSLDIDDTGGAIGIFRELKGSVQDITFAGVTDVGSRDKSGGHRGLIAGEANGASISNITVNYLSIRGGDPYTAEAAGGIVGRTDDTTLSDIVIKEINIQRPAYAGGIVGHAASKTIIMDSNVSKFVLADATGTVNGKSYQDFRCENKDSKYQPGDTQPEGCGVGGLVGFVSGKDSEIKTSFAKTPSTSKDDGIRTERNAGGLIGLVDIDATLKITNSYAHFAMKDVHWRAAGVIGRSGEDGSSDKGSINNVTLEKVYSIGNIDATQGDSGRGTLGNKSSTSYSVIAKESYFDKDRAGGDAGNKNPNGCGEGCETISIGKTLAQLKSSSTYPSSVWDRDIWCVSPTGVQYPLFRYQIPAADQRDECL